MIANGNPQMPAIAAIRSIFDIPFTFLMIFPPQPTEWRSQVSLQFPPSEKLSNIPVTLLKVATLY
jgi:hypothetical protein